MTRIDGRWHVSFVESPSQDPFDFHPALAVALEGKDWHQDLELVGAATDLHQPEGPVFDLDLKPRGRLDAPYESHGDLLIMRGKR